MSLLGVTFRALDSFTMLMMLMFLSPRSTPLTYVKWRSACSARTIWDQPRLVRSWRIFFPSSDWDAISMSRCLRGIVFKSIDDEYYSPTLEVAQRRAQLESEGVN